MNASVRGLRLPDSHPFRLFGSDTQVSVLFCLLGKNPNVPNAVSGLEVPSKTSYHLFSQLYVFVGSHCIPFNLPGHSDSKLSNNDNSSASDCL